jgi:Tetratricopeptide repeat
MAIVIEAFSVVVRNSTLAAKYPGGVVGYSRDCPNATFCTDGHLSRIGFMMPQDADAFVSALAAKGLTPSRKGAAEDAVVIRAEGGPVRACAWIESERTGNVTVAWMAGADRGELHAPDGWTADRSVQLMTAEDIKHLEYVRTQGNVDVYRDRRTGKELYAGRTASAPDVSRHDALYQQASNLIKGLILVDNLPPGPLSAGDRRKLQDAIPLYEEVIGINPGNWAAMWLLGKVYQRLAEFEKGFGWFSRAHRVNPDQPDVAREAAIAALDLGHPEEAIPMCEAAIEAKPDDPGLKANLALALLFSQKPQEALAIANDALARDPSDRITANLARIIREVATGRRPCPKHLRDLQ